MSKKTVPGIFRFVSMLFFQCLKKRMGKKTVPDIFRFISTLFLYLKKGMSKKTVRYFQICKYAFLIFGKGDEQKKLPGIFGFVSMLF